MNKNIFLAFLSGIFLLAVACNQPAKQPETEAPATAVVSNPNQKSMDYHDKLMSSFNPNWETEEPATTDYPAYYGGSFIDNDGKFVVCVVGDPAQHRSTIAKIIGSDDFLMEKCTYSYRQMMEVMDKIDAFLSNASVDSEHPFLTYFAGAGADVFDNRVVVQLTEVNDAAVQAFKKDISNSPVVVFEQGDMPVLH